MSNRQPAASKLVIAVGHRDLAAEARDTESAVTLWHQKALEGRPPDIAAFDLHRLGSDWGYRFLISGDEDVDTAVFIAYGLPFARLLDLPQKPCITLPLIRQLPLRYCQLFAEGYGEAIRQAVPARFSGAAVSHDAEIELYRAAFLPLSGRYSVRPLIFGSFNYRVVPAESVSDAFNLYNRLGERAREGEPRTIVTVVDAAAVASPNGQIGTLLARANRLPRR